MTAMFRSDRAAYGSKIPPAMLARFRKVGRGRCAYCLRKLRAGHRASQRICTRQRCRDAYAEEYQQGQPRKRAKVAQLQDGPTPGKLVAQLTCGHRLIVWRARADRSRRCPLCAQGARRNARPLDLMAPAA
jgi:hypothetical protein